MKSLGQDLGSELSPWLLCPPPAHTSEEAANFSGPQFPIYKIERTEFTASYGVLRINSLLFVRHSATPVKRTIYVPR